MVHIATSSLLGPDRNPGPFGGSPLSTGLSVLVVRDGDTRHPLLDVICEFFDIAVEHVDSEAYLGPLLRAVQPIAVIAEVDGMGQDGCHVLMTVAAHDPDLPVLLLTKGDPALAGAVDAVREIWGLARVATVDGLTETGPLVDFLCHAARDAGMSRMMRL